MARIGPQMAYLASRVRVGDSICSLVDRCYRTARGHESRTFGYRAVHRALRAGLIELLDGAPAGQYRLAPLGWHAAQLVVRADATTAAVLGDALAEVAGEKEGI